MAASPTFSVSTAESQVLQNFVRAGTHVDPQTHLEERRRRREHALDRRRLDANGHRERRQFESRKEADAFRIATESQMRAGTFRGDAAKFTVKDAADASSTIAKDDASAASA